MARLRLGVALLIPAPLDREVDALRKALGDPGYGRIPAHLTLVPPVNLPSERYGEAVAVLASAAARTQPFRVRLGPPATFLPDSPTLYLPVAETDQPPIEALRALVFRDPLERPLQWPFVPHVTIADEIAPERIEAAVAALGSYTAEASFDRVHLLQESDRVWRPVAGAMFRDTGCC
ncbi:MAG TPA: 2'-5' RNA ligase family protein [Actinomycetota bacterium]|jgi:2'-5' RNA ligase